MSPSYEDLTAMKPDSNLQLGPQMFSAVINSIMGEVRQLKDQGIELAPLMTRRMQDAYPRLSVTEIEDLTANTLKAFEYMRNRKDLYMADLMSLDMRSTWYESGMQTFEVGHQVAAQLMTTRVSLDVLETLRLPWPAFNIRIPPGLLTAQDEDRALPITDILVSDHRERGHVDFQCAFVSFGEGPVNLWTHQSSLATLLDAGLDEVDNVFSYLDITNSDQRTLTLIKNLIASLLVHLDNKSLQVKAVGGSHKAGQKRGSKEPTRRIYRATMPVVLDARPFVREYVAGNRKSPSVQGFVMGHHKMQACGKNLSERKRIFVEPYWRGPEDAPIAIRSHRVG